MSPDSTPVAKQSVHVVIAGGGPAGTATALALACRGFSSLIVERAACRGASIGESLPPEVQAALQELGLWERFLADGHRPSLFNLVAWGGPRLSCREHLFSPYGQGWHVDRGRFDALLTAVARERGVLILAGARMESVARSEGGGWRIEIAAPDGRREIRAAWLVDATGRPATLSRHLGGKRARADRLVGVTAFLTPRPGAAPLEPGILVEAEEEGWWYSAPLPDGRAVAALLTDAGLPDSAALRSPAGWERRLDATLHTRRRLSRYMPPEATIVRAAEPALTEMPSLPGFLPVGDAAAAFDPLSGMGVLAALRGGIEAAAAIAESDAGASEALSRYEDLVRRRFHDYLRLCEEHYAQELRWPASRFWSRRRVPDRAQSRDGILPR